MNFSLEQTGIEEQNSMKSLSAVHCANCVLMSASFCALKVGQRTIAAEMKVRRVNVAISRPFESLCRWVPGADSLRPSVESCPGVLEALGRRNESARLSTLQDTDSELNSPGSCRPSFESFSAATRVGISDNSMPSAVSIIEHNLNQGTEMQ